MPALEAQALRELGGELLGDPVDAHLRDLALGRRAASRDLDHAVRELVHAVEELGLALGGEDQRARGRGLVGGHDLHVEAVAARRAP